MFVSLLHYVKQELANLSPEALASWPEDTPRLDLKSLAARKLAAPKAAVATTVQ